METPSRYEYNFWPQLTSARIVCSLQGNIGCNFDLLLAQDDAGRRIILCPTLGRRLCSEKAGSIPKGHAIVMSSKVSGCDVQISKDLQKPISIRRVPTRGLERLLRQTDPDAANFVASTLESLAIGRPSP